MVVVYLSYIECMVLGLLNQGYRYGHELDKVVEERKMRLWTKMTRASMYQALTRLEKKGWVESSTEKNSKMPERKVYILTEAGNEALKNMIFEGLVSDEIMELNICVPISFLYTLPSDDAILQLRKREQAISQLLRDIPFINEEEDDYLGRKANAILIRKCYETQLQWLNWLINELIKKEKG